MKLLVTSIAILGLFAPCAAQDKITIVLDLKPGVVQVLESHRRTGLLKEARPLTQAEIDAGGPPTTPTPLFLSVEDMLISFMLPEIQAILQANPTAALRSLSTTREAAEQAERTEKIDAVKRGTQ